jgi:hypothetical protein
MLSVRSTVPVRKQPVVSDGILVKSCLTRLHWRCSNAQRYFGEHGWFEDALLAKQRNSNPFYLEPLEQ